MKQNFTVGQVARRREAFVAQRRGFRRAAAEPLIASFCQAYPEVEVEIAAGAEPVALAAEGIDAGMRLGSSPPT